MSELSFKPATFRRERRHKQDGIRHHRAAFYTENHSDNSDLAHGMARAGGIGARPVTVIEPLKLAIVVWTEANDLSSEIKRLKPI